MKKLTLIFIVTLSSFSYANAAVRSRDFTCTQLQSMLKRDGSLTLVKGWGRNTYYASYDACTVYQTATPSYESSKDKSFCFLGYTCIDNGGY